MFRQYNQEIPGIASLSPVATTNEQLQLQPGESALIFSRDGGYRAVTSVCDSLDTDFETQNSVNRRIVALSTALALPQVMLLLENVVKELNVPDLGA